MSDDARNRLTRQLSASDNLPDNTPADLSPLAQNCLRSLLRTWFEFERDLNRVAVVAALERGRFSLADYRELLLNLRQQVIEGARWISRSASSFDRDYTDVRSLIIGHAREEHRDYELLEQNYLAAGGSRECIEQQARNVGTEALHGFLVYRASQPNPVDLVGAMWIIEGIGQKMASGWADRIRELTGCGEECLTFMRYHGDNDQRHLEKLYRLLDRVCIDEPAIQHIVRTARVTARLYCLQLEEVGNE